MAEELKKFQTTNLADYYSKNGSEYSTMGDITPYSAGGTKFDNTSPIEQGFLNQTPLDDFIAALQNPEKLAAVQEKSGIEVFALPTTPDKVGISPAGFSFIPSFTTQNTNVFNFISTFDTGLIGANVANNMVGPINAGITVSNNMIAPVNSGLGVSNNMGNPPGTAPLVSNNMGNPPGTAPSVANNMGNPPGTAPSVTNNMGNPLGTAPSVANNMSNPNHGVGLLTLVDGQPNINALGFTGGMTTTQFVGISGGPTNGTFTYSHTGNQGLGILGIWNGFNDVDATGFVPGKHHLSPSDFTGISGLPGNMTFNFNDVANGGGQIWAWNRSIYNSKIGEPVDGIQNAKANGFILNKIHMDNISDFKGVSFPKPYNYPVEPSPFQSYTFTDSIYPSIMDKTQVPSSPGSADGIGQAYNVRHGGNVTGRKTRFTNRSADNIQLVGNFKTTVEDLYNSLPLQDEAFNSGFYGTQPYITRDIGSNWSLFSDGPGPIHGDTAVRGGVGTSLNRALKDVERIGQYMLSPNGLIFIAKNVGMQLSNPKWQGATILGLSRTRVYPLGLSTIAQVATNAIGLHLVRHGLGPLEGDGTHYEKSVNEIGRDNYTKGTVYGVGLTRTKSRLYALASELGSGYFDSDTMDAAKPKTEGTGFFAKAVKWTKKQLQKLTPSREKIDVLSGLLGPHSVYGIGRTRIFRSNVGFGVGQHTNLTGTHGDSVSLTTSWANVPEKERGSKLVNTANPQALNPNFGNNGWTPKEGNRYSDNKDEEGGFKSEVAPQIGLMHHRPGDDANTSGRESPSLRDKLGAKDYETGLSHRYETIAYDKIGKIQSQTKRLNDFREFTFSNTDIDLGIAKRIFQQPNGGDAGEGPAWNNEDRVTRFNEDYGRVGVDRSNRLADLGLNDKAVGRNAVGMPEPVNALNEVVIDGNPTATEFPDLILFQFKTFQESRNAIQFRAMLTDFTDTLTPNFEDVGYVGRTTPSYLFKSIARETKFSFKMYAMTRQELDAQYKRLNRLMQSISPGYTSGNLPIGPMLKLTIGNYFVDTPVVCDSFDISIPDSSPWDIDPGRQLPLYLEVSMGCKIMFNETENYDPNTGAFKTPTEDKKFPSQVGLAILKSTSNYFNGVNSNFGRGESAPVANGE